MAYIITSIEKNGIQQWGCAMLGCFLQRKFHQIPPQYLDMLHKADSETFLLRWSDAIKSLEEIFES